MRNLLQNLLSDSVIVPGSPQPTPTTPVTEVPEIPENTGTEILTDQTLEVMATAPIEDPSVEVNDEVLQLEAYLTGLEDYQYRCVEIAGQLGQAKKISKQVMAGLESATVSLTEYYGLKKPKISKEGFMDTAKEVGKKIREVIVELIRKIKEALTAFFSKDNFILKKIEALIQKCKDKKSGESGGSNSSETVVSEERKVAYPSILTLDGKPIDSDKIENELDTRLRQVIEIFYTYLSLSEKVTKDKAGMDFIESASDPEQLRDHLLPIFEVLKNPLGDGYNWKTNKVGGTYIDLELGGAELICPNFPNLNANFLVDEFLKGNRLKTEKTGFLSTSSYLEVSDKDQEETLVESSEYPIDDLIGLLENLKEFITSSDFLKIKADARKVLDETEDYFENLSKSTVSGVWKSKLCDNLMEIFLFQIVRPYSTLFRFIDKIRDAILRFTTVILMSGN